MSVNQLQSGVSESGARATARARTTILAAPLLKLSTRLLTTGRWSQASEFRVGKKGFKKSQICLKGKSILFYFLVFNVKFVQYSLHM